MSNSQHFKRIGLIARFGTRNIPDTLRALHQFLQAQSYQVVIEENTASMMPATDSPTVTAKDLNQHCDLLIVVGGDGSLLHAAHIAIENELPILGINRGRLGFLTDIPPNDLARVGQVLKGFYKKEQRFLLDIAVNSSEQNETLSALNDVVLLHGDAAHMIEFEIFVDDQFVCRQLADGLICATPTGSTAYALSGGGPIMHPGLETLVLVPMFPHTLSNRPVVVSANSEIRIDLIGTDASSAFVSADGLQRIDINEGTTLHISKQSQALQLIHPSDYNYFTTLREKLGWQHYAQRAS
jgi:NAD+ kinase